MLEIFQIQFVSAVHQAKEKRSSLILHHCHLVPQCYPAITKGSR